MNSKLIKAFNIIFTCLLLLALLPFFTYQGNKNLLILLMMLLALVASTFSYLTQGQGYSEKADQSIYLTEYLSHIILIAVMFLIALWELSNTGNIGVWFFVLLLTIALVRPVVNLLLKAFHR